MKHGSLFAGIGGFDLGFERAGIETVWTVENDKNCNQVLATHWPDVERHYEIKLCGWPNIQHVLAPVDIISGGFPCQDLSVAGRREGLAGERSGLWYEFARIVGEMEPQWVVVENVPGLFSSGGGRDFLVIVRALEQFGYCVSWRVLDSQFFGVPQRRRRVFIVGSLGNAGSIEVLFEQEGGKGDIAESREEGKGIANGTEAVSVGALQARDYKGVGTQYVDEGKLIVSHENLSGSVTPADHHRALRSGASHSYQFAVGPLDAGGADRPNTHGYAGMGSACNQSVDAGHILAWEMSHADEAVRESGDVAPTLQQRMGTGGNQVPLVGVRRLTPTECERLQGFPDGWTEGLSDTQRYKTLGNAVTVNVTEWLGRRLLTVEL